MPSCSREAGAVRSTGRMMATRRAAMLTRDILGESSQTLEETDAATALVVVCRLTNERYCDLLASKGAAYGECSRARAHPATLRSSSSHAAG
jgi:hypothetical protein